MEPSSYFTTIGTLQSQDHDADDNDPNGDAETEYRFTDAPVTAPVDGEKIG